MAEKSIERRAVLYFQDYTFDISDINEDMEQSSAVNPVETDADFAIGVSCMSELKFSLNNLYQLISENSLANKEFLLQRGKMTEYKSVLDIFKKVRKPLFVQHGGFTFAASDRAPYLSVYDSKFVLQNAPQQPPQPVKSLFIVDGKLYCVHNLEPYLTAYSVSGETLAIQPQIALTDFYKNKLLGYVKNARCFNKQGNVVTEYVSVYTDMKISDVVAETWTYSNFGYYIVTKAEKINDTKISVLAYDRMKKFEVLADGFLNGLTYPLPLKTLLTKLCAFVGVAFNNKTLINENYSVPRNFKTDGVTCRQVLQWIAQISANFAHIDFDGKLNLSWYTNLDSQIDAHNSTKIDIADYVVQPIDKVQARAFESDIGVIVPIDERKTNAYIIENNPLLYATSDAQIRPAITNIYNAIKNFSYIPFKVKTIVVNEQVKAGLIISATTVKDKQFNAHVMQSTLKGVTGLTAEYSATGNEYRKIQTDAVNQKIMMLNGRTNAIIANIEEFSVTLKEVKDTGEKNTAQLEIQSKQISLRVEQKVYDENNKVIGEHFSSLEQTVSGFKLAVDNNKLIFDANGLTVINGGFRINNGKKDVFYVDILGSVNAIGSFTAENEITGLKTTMSGGKIMFYADATEACSLYAKIGSDGTPFLFLNGKISYGEFGGILTGTLRGGSITCDSVTSKMGAFDGFLFQGAVLYKNRQDLVRSLSVTKNSSGLVTDVRTNTENLMYMSYV